MLRKTVGSSEMAAAIKNWNKHETPFFFSSETVSLLGQGCEYGLHEAVPLSKLNHTIQSLLQQSKQTTTDNPIVLGMIPFNEDAPCHFVVPNRLLVSSTLRHQDLSVTPDKASAWRCVMLPEPQEYGEVVDLALKEMSAGALKKVVLSRAMTLNSATTLNPAHVLMSLVKQNPSSYRFCANTGGEEYLVGASPELLVARRGVQVVANPLAGSRKRDADDQLNDDLERSLLETDKDLREHALVVDAMASVLQSHCKNLHVPMMPSVISTPAMLHLSTLMEGTLWDSNVSALQLATELHPTPAVCGEPKYLAQQFINEYEPFERGFFTGVIGWMDSRGNGEWVVVIRSALVAPNSMTVFAGAGIVPGSVAQEEIDETANKMATILNAVNAQQHQGQSQDRSTKAGAV
ncbi:isochorismate synthase [Bermanella sp. WJH001]|uniref:isochorismate synthase n=1 Tax=Bermanella sp. WJH001 TaxID=3048005 RepID=UPI0024BE7A37|nr:isochorismate synthase [Bermanella sp. WJH001]MDJ1539156.1 isochorismate synthase [Bermanella sp. WJH001]